MNKKIIVVGLLMLLCLSFCGCGSDGSESEISSSSSYITDESAKGSRNNPYNVGETINLKSIYGYNGYFGNTSIDLTFSVEKAFSLQEGVGIRKNFSVFNNVPAAIIKFTLNSSFQDSDSFPFDIRTVSTDMTENAFGMEDLTTNESIYKVFAGTEYRCYWNTEYDSTSGVGKPAKYLTISYFTDENHSEKKVVYINIEK